MLEQLFGSKTRYRLIKLFFQRPEGRFFVREMTRLLETQINAVRRELKILCDSGIVEETSETATGGKGKVSGPKKKYYRLNRASLLYPELQALLLKEKILGEQRFVNELREKGGNIRLLLMTGTFTGHKEAPTDMLIVGNVKKRNIEKFIAEYEKECGSDIRYTFMDEDEFIDRRHVMDKFIFDIFEAEHMKVINDMGI